jgi:hypothetical protein
MEPGASGMTHTRDNRLARRGAALLATAGLVIVAACGEGSGGADCLPEDVQRCECADGHQGYAVCDPAAGSGYGACNCALDASPYLAQPAPEAGADADGDAASSGGLSFMSPCSTAPGSPQCPAGTSCDEFPAKGPHCSKPCKEATDCPPPSPGCNMMGICKAP